MAKRLEELNCVVLGAGGFLGTNLCRALNGQVRSLRAFGRRQTFPQALAGVDWVFGDFSDSTALAPVLNGCDVVFHLVNATTPASSNMDKIADVNTSVINTLRFLDLCREADVRRVVFVSSGGTVYGIPQQLPIAESAPTNPICAYGISKLAVEKYLALYNYLYGLDYRVLRVANPYGPYQLATKNQGVIGAFLKKALAGGALEVWGDGAVVRDYLYVDDAVAALVKAATHDGPSRIFNVGGGVGYSLNDVIDIVEQVLGSSLKVERKPARPADVPKNVLDVSLACAELDWQPQVRLEAGVASTAKWLARCVA